MAYPNEKCEELPEIPRNVLKIISPLRLKIKDFECLVCSHFEGVQSVDL